MGHDSGRAARREAQGADQAIKVAIDAHVQDEQASQATMRTGWLVGGPARCRWHANGTTSAPTWQAR